MLMRKFRIAVLSLAALCSSLGAVACAQDGMEYSPLTVTAQVPPTLQYNYYYPVPGSNGIPARMYLCPRPTPAHVGYTYITYQALAPHEFLWRHQARYFRPYDGGVTVTTIRWH